MTNVQLIGDIEIGLVVFVGLGVFLIVRDVLKKLRSAKTTTGETSKKLPAPPVLIIGGGVIFLLTIAAKSQDGTTQAVCGITAVCFLIGGFKLLKRNQEEATQQAANHRAAQAQAKAVRAVVVETMQRPPIWPPRKPDDWGMAEENAYRQALQHHQHLSQVYKGNITIPPPSPPVQKSWELHHRKEQDEDELQIRWAQSEKGEWVAVEWGNRSRPPVNGGPLPVFQAMKREDNGYWAWIKIYDHEALEWQRGPQRMLRTKLNFTDGSAIYVRRPCGAPGHIKPPPPLESDGGRGSSDERGADELVKLGAVRK